MTEAWYPISTSSSKVGIHKVDVLSEDPGNSDFMRVRKSGIGIVSVPKDWLFDTADEAAAHMENRLFDEKVERTRMLANYLKRYNGAMKAEMKITVVE